MRKIISLIVMLSCCGIIFAEGEQGLSQSNEAVVMEEAVEVSSKLKKIGNDYLIFDIIIQNNSDRNLYFYPEGVLSRSNIVDDTLFIIINDDAEYGKSFVSAHEPYWKESACMELKPGRILSLTPAALCAKPFVLCIMC